MSIPATVNKAVKLAMVLENGTTGLYPQAEIYDGATLEDTVDLVDLGKGRYEGSWTPTAIGTFSALFNVYSDPAHTVELTPLVYTREIEQIFVMQSNVDDLAAQIIRLLGLNLENTRIDRCVYDSAKMLESARLRVFDSKANTLASTEGGVGEPGTIAEYTLGALHYGPNQLRTNVMVKD